MNNTLRTVEVFVGGWQLDCCGKPFGVGSTVTWDVHADEPNSGRDIPRFVEDHHGSADESVLCEVTGEVLDIAAISNRLVSVPGSRSMTNDAADVGEEPIERAERFHRPPDGYTAMGFWVLLAIDAALVLPEYVEPPWVAERRERDRILEETAAALLDSDVGRQLSQLSARIADQFAGRVECRSARSGVTVQPLSPNRCVVMWTLTQKGITVHMGDGTWSLAATPKGVAKLERFIAAASLGDVDYLPW